MIHLWLMPLSLDGHDLLIPTVVPVQVVAFGNGKSLTLVPGDLKVNEEPRDFSVASLYCVLVLCLLAQSSKHEISGSSGVRQGAPLKLLSI